MKKNIILNQQSQSISINSENYFNAIQSLNIFSNIPLVDEGPKGLRYTLKNDTNRFDCFCWQTPNELSFNCFEILNQFEETNTKNLFNELLISCEGIEFSTSTEINITLNIF